MTYKEFASQININVDNPPNDCDMSREITIEDCIYLLNSLGRQIRHLQERNRWHIGTPKEEGWYLVVVEWKDYTNKANRRYKYFEFKNNNWIYNQEFGSVDVIAYWGQKIDPYKEGKQ